MTNPLKSHVQIIPFPPPVVYYTPAGFPTVLTDAVLVDGDGDLLLVDNGWRLKIISVQQVEKIVSARTHERNEAIDQEWQEWDEANSYDD